MKRSSLVIGLFGFLTAASLSVISAQAENLRSWVSVAGNDSTTCTRTQPCQTFTAAIAQTSVGGVVACIDNGLFASTAITKSITIDCEGTYAAVSNISVNAGANDKITLRGLAVNGVGINTTGISFVNGGELNIENVSFENYSGAGIEVNKSAFGVVAVRNSSFSRMAVGIRMQATSGSISAAVSDSSFNNLTNTGIEVGKGTYVTVSGSKFTAIYGFGIAAMTNTSYASATNNVFSSSYIGMSARVAGAKINATGNQFFGNSIAFNVAAGGVFFSGGDNKIDVNPGNPPTGALTSR